MGAGQSKEQLTQPSAVATSSSIVSDSSSSLKNAEESGGGCPMKNADGTYRTMPGFASLFGAKHPPVAGTNAVMESEKSSIDPVTSTQQPRQLYDVYSRPLPVDPTNNMPMANPTAIARNLLPSPNQSIPLQTERVSSTIPKETSGKETWTYPSPQMFYNALARKGKLDPETKEEDMASVVAIHNCMNEGTWKRVLQWEEVLGHDCATKGPALTKFMGRPTDLSPKAFIKHYLFGHPLPFDRHDWTVTRTNPADGSTRDVRYVIDYYHDEGAARTDAGSGMPRMDAPLGVDGGLRSLLVDVRPAADGIDEIWGRIVTMPLAQRGCRSMLECLLYQGQGFGKKSDFEPLPLSPSDSLKTNLRESEVVWENIKKDAANKKGVGAKDGIGEACTSDSLVTSPTTTGQNDVQLSKVEAKKLAETYSKILAKCETSRLAVKNCDSEESCRKAYAGMTVCAGQFMCPLQHTSLLASLESYGKETNEDVAEAKINTAMEILGECVSEYDKSASIAKRQFPDLFEVVSTGRKRWLW